MKTITMSDDDAATVHAILMTNAEMQDARSVEGLQVLSDMKQQGVRKGQRAIKRHLQVIDDDVSNMRRIASTFGDV